MKPNPEPLVFSKGSVICPYPFQPISLFLVLSRFYVLAFGCNELGTAILQRNNSAVRNLISQAPSLIFERDLNGMTPFHHAVSWRDGLSIILEQVPVEHFAEDLAWDIFDYAILVYRKNHWEMCLENRHCSECIMLFLEHSWYFTPCPSQGRHHGTIRLILDHLSPAA